MSVNFQGWWTKLGGIPRKNSMDDLGFSFHLSLNLTSQPTEGWDTWETILVTSTRWAPTRKTRDGVKPILKKCIVLLCFFLPLKSGIIFHLLYFKLLKNRGHLDCKSTVLDCRAPLRRAPSWKRMYAWRLPCALQVRKKNSGCWTCLEKKGYPPGN